MHLSQQVNKYMCLHCMRKYMYFNVSLNISLHRANFTPVHLHSLIDFSLLSWSVSAGRSQWCASLAGVFTTEHMVHSGRGGYTTACSTLLNGNHNGEASDDGRSPLVVLGVYSFHYSTSLWPFREPQTISP